MKLRILVWYFSLINSAKVLTEYIGKLLLYMYVHVLIDFLKVKFCEKDFI